jgi:hypothetical protein
VKDLFIELYLDEDVDVLLAHLLRGRGFSAATTLEANRLGTSDLDQFLYATAQGKTILTHNHRHFAELAKEHFEAGQHHTGVIIADRHPTYEILRRLLRILNNVTADEMQDQVRYI